MFSTILIRADPPGTEFDKMLAFTLISIIRIVELPNATTHCIVYLTFIIR